MSKSARKIIAHRGNIHGVNKERENTLSYLDEAWLAGYESETDLWVLEYGELRLGHDSPEHLVTPDDILTRANHLWIHCKNIAALYWVMEHDLHGFFHDRDAYTLTTQGWIWAYPGMPVNDRCILVVRAQDGSATPGAAGYCVDDVTVVDSLP